MAPPKAPQGPFTVDYQSEDELKDSEYQVRWSKIMDQGKYKNASTYEKVEVLLLRWADNCNDLDLTEEVEELERVFEKDFNYGARVAYLDSSIEQKLQVQINGKVASFVSDHDGQNTLLIVYYAGHGRPGRYYGSLEFTGKFSLNDAEDAKMQFDTCIWNKTEKLLEPAAADVLKIFDCCYAGNLALTRGNNKLFEFLAACKELDTTAVPGARSFTSALTFALKALVKDQPDGRFTTVELLRKITLSAPLFPEDQVPVLSDRVENTQAGRIMLHPIKKEGIKREGSDPQTPQSETSEPDPAKKRTVTLHLEFNEKPSIAHIERLGTEINAIFERHNLNVNRVKWGGMESVVAGCARRWKARMDQSRRHRQLTLNTIGSDGLLSPILPSPQATRRSSPRLRGSMSSENLIPNSPSSLHSNDGPRPDKTSSEEQMQGRQKRQKRS